MRKPSIHSLPLDIGMKVAGHDDRSGACSRSMFSNCDHGDTIAALARPRPPQELASDQTRLYHDRPDGRLAQGESASLTRKRP